ncbi:MAG: diguanylate cyclase [Burkholderiaceae bacterium]|nr:diguanylate cyclase [Burkholderiaceae bacterium]
MHFASAPAQRAKTMTIIVMVLALLYAITGQVNLIIVQAQYIHTPTLFIPEGIALAAALRFGPRVWPGVFLGQLALGLLNDIPLSAAMAVAGVNSTEIALGALLFVRLKANPALLTLRDLSILLGLIWFVLQPFSATFGLWFMHLYGAGAISHMPSLWVDWWFGNALGQSIIAPLLLGVYFHRHADKWRVRELLPLALILAALCWVILIEIPQISPALPFAVLTPVLVVIAIRYGIGPGCAATFLVASITLVAVYFSLELQHQAPAVSLKDLNIFLVGIVPAVQAIAILSRQQLQSARTLTAVERQYQRIFEQAPVLINAFNHQGKCLLWNDECIKVFGYERDYILDHPDPLTLFYPDPQDRYTVIHGSTQKNDKSIFTEWSPLHRDGHQLATLWTNIEMPDGMLFNVGIDITDRRQNEARLRVAASVFEHSYDGIVIINPDRLITDVNPAGAQLLGYQQHDLIGQPLASYRPHHYSEKFYQDLWGSVANNDAWHGEVWMQHRLEGKRPLNTTVIAVRDPDLSILRYIVVFNDISELKAKEVELQRMAHYDSLTGLPNRYLLNDRLQQGIVNARRSGTLLAACYMDLDGFKYINDTMGHEAGDIVLVEVADRVRTALRRKDTVARMGGDELALLLTNLAHPNDCCEVLDRVLASIMQPITLPNGQGKVTASIGVSFFHHDGDSFDVLFSKADTAMYEAKRAGKNRYAFYDSELDHRVAIAARQT